MGEQGNRFLLSIVIAIIFSITVGAGGCRGGTKPVVESADVKLDLVPDLSCTGIAFDVWQTPSLRDDGFLFEVQVMGYGPFTRDVVSRSVQKYKLGETTSYHPIGGSIGEWGYSFHHLVDGARDGSGRVHYGGYPEPPETRAQALQVIHDYLMSLMEGQPRPWSSFNGHYPYHHYAAEWGFDIIGSEIGENINNYQMMIAFNRGAARQYNKPWFIDFSSWHGPAITDYSNLKPWGDNSGPEYGHSVSLHRRAYFMSYMAGAHAVVAEAGGVNFFLEKRDDEGCFLPSPLGEVGQEFYDFTQRHPDPGMPYTPFGILIDYYHGTYAGWKPLNVFNHFPYDKGDLMTWELLNLFFPSGWEVQGRKEAGTLTYSPFGDTCDIILQNASDEVLRSYPIIIASGDIQFSSEELARLIGYVKEGGVLLLNTVYARQLPQDLIELVDSETGLSSGEIGKGTLFLYGPLYNVLGDGRKLISELARRFVPFNFSERVEFLINRRGNSWVVTVINNDGISKDFRESPKVDESKEKKVRITYTGDDQIAQVINWLTDEEADLVVDNGEYMIDIDLPPGEFAVMEFVLGSES